MTSCRHWKWILAAATALSAVVVTAHGQERGQGFRVGWESPNDPSFLLVSESVQKELALTDEQKASLQKLRDEEENGGHPFFGGIKGLSQEAIQQRLDSHAKVNCEKLASILSAQQLERLNELHIQVAGVVALTFEDVAAKIELSMEQRDELKKLGDESRQRLADLYVTTNGQPPDELKRQQSKPKQLEIVAERENKSFALLTDEQKAEFEKLQGEKFDTSTVQPVRKKFTRRGRIDAPGGGAASENRTNAKLGATSSPLNGPRRPRD